MSSDVNTEKILIFSDYGYVKIDKKDLDSHQTLINFESDNKKLYGSLNVKKY